MQSQMSDNEIIRQASEYAISAHKRIDQRRKYTNQPYHVHLKAVAKIVSETGGDAGQIAAAWLHDTVEDTPATFDDIEEEFGQDIATLVEELTDVSRPSDGNRVKRKRIDRKHLAHASPRAKSVKLADLIDNCQDIVRHDPKFARIYLAEMQMLIEVLGEGDARLYKRAQNALLKGQKKIGISAETMMIESDRRIKPSMLPGFEQQSFRRMFFETFSVHDIARPLLSFDDQTSCQIVLEALENRGFDVAIVTQSGEYAGYVRRDELKDGICQKAMRVLSAGQMIEANAPISEAVNVLTLYDIGFVTLFDEIGAVISREDMNKPAAKMWLFGIITMMEAEITDLIGKSFDEEEWIAFITPARAEKARMLLLERKRLKQSATLLDCLQFSDKGQIVFEIEGFLQSVGYATKSAAKRSLRDLESLRNNLAHSQNITDHDWAPIARLTKTFEEALRN